MKTIYTLSIEIVNEIRETQKNNIKCSIPQIEMKSIGFMPLLCTYRLNCVRRTSRGWWDEWDDTALQTQDTKFGPWRSEAEHSTSRWRRLSAILSFTSGWGRNSLFLSSRRDRKRTPNSSVKGSGANHYRSVPNPPPPPSPPRIDKCMNECVKS